MSCGVEKAYRSGYRPVNASATPGTCHSSTDGCEGAGLCSLGRLEPVSTAMIAGLAGPAWLARPVNL